MWGMRPLHDPLVTGGPDSGYAVTGYPLDEPARTAAWMADEVIPLPVGGGVTSPKTGTFNFFLTATPYPGLAEKTNGVGKGGACIFGIENLDPFDCCLTTIFSAAGCKA